jgi:hypothetical protein
MPQAYTHCKMIWTVDCLASLQISNAPSCRVIVSNADPRPRKYCFAVNVGDRRGPAYHVGFISGSVENASMHPSMFTLFCHLEVPRVRGSIVMHITADRSTSWAVMLRGLLRTSSR